MPRATVTVEYVNEPKPGKKKGSIKTKELGYIGVWPDKLPQFTKGMIYEIQYKENGEFKDFEGIVQQQPSQQSNGHARNSAPDNSRMIFITGVVGRAMGSGKFAPIEIKDLALEAADAWDRLSSLDRLEEAPY